MTQKGKITVFKQKNANEAEALQKQLQGKQKQHVTQTQSPGRHRDEPINPLTHSAEKKPEPQ